VLGERSESARCCTFVERSGDVLLFEKLNVSAVGRRSNSACLSVELLVMGAPWSFVCLLFVCIYVLYVCFVS
jgi:hypothetical protein